MHIFVVSMTLLNDAGELLIVRKRGTHRFMLPGGKVDAGETHVEAILREVAEEVSLTIDPDAVDLLGHWSAEAANEPGWTISSDVFIAPFEGTPVAASEIEELHWLPLDDETSVTLSPMLTEHVLPALRARRDQR